MGKLAIESAMASQPRAGLVCRLRKKTEGRAAQSPLAGEVELENTASDVLEIDVQSSPLQYLDLVVEDAGGKVVSAWHYGDCFPPLETGYVLRLRPGEKYTGPVSLLGNVPPEKRVGCFTVRAIYEYKTLKAISEPLQVQLPSHEKVAGD
jgi:hypothetical protein